MQLTETFKAVKNASRQLGLLDDDTINAVLKDLSSLSISQTDYLLNENEKDLERMPMSDPKYDRLKLTEQRIKDLANDLKNVSRLKSPLGKVLDKRSMANGLQLTKITVPLGVIGIIYEARPNVTFDVFSLCLKSGNACILKGGSDAEFSNKAIAQLIKQVLNRHHVDENVMALLPTDREATNEMLHATEYIDIIIPRGSQKLINFVRQNAKVPVIETGAGIVHTYFDKSGNAEKGSVIINNAKTRRPSVCNALDCLIIHQDRLNDLPVLTAPLIKNHVQLFVDEKAFDHLIGHYPDQLLNRALPEHFGTEFLDYKMSVKTVENLQEALEHINHYSSKHSEAVIAEDQSVVESFLKSVDAAAVYANASTAFTDGAQFGLGAEIGISTQKLHARGPMALEELTSYKWMIRGSGQARIP